MSGHGQRTHRRLITAIAVLALVATACSATTQGSPATRTGEPPTERIPVIVDADFDASDIAAIAILLRDPAVEVRRIKGQPGKDIVTYGFGRLGRALMEHGLLDEIRLWVHPFFIGGTDTDSLLFGHSPAARLDLVNTQALNNGIVVLSYTVRHRPGS